MPKVLHCRDAGFDCSAVVSGETVEDIMSQVRPHAKEAHGVLVDPAMESQLLQLIRSSPESP
jgi:predicted small metal-binding protein